MTDESSPDPPLETLDDRRSPALDRREFLGFIGATLASAACGDTPGGTNRSQSFPTIEPDAGGSSPPAPQPPTLPDDPFTLGVACGDPLPDGFVLWTRLAPRPIEGGGMPPTDVPVIWEIARLASGWLHTEPRLAHSAHVDIRGLDSDSWYVYRFRVGNQWTSQVGRARTFPQPDASPDRFRLATASCQNYRDGYYSA
ncbi:MAG: alkaline phosphatase, partial [Bradymonadaceae bacterium]